MILSKLREGNRERKKKKKAENISMTLERTQHRPNHTKTQEYEGRVLRDGR